MEQVKDEQSNFELPEFIKDINIRNRELQSYALKINDAMKDLSHTINSIFTEERLKTFQLVSKSAELHFDNAYKILKTIDWKKISENLSELSSDVIAFSKEMARENIYLHIDYLDEFSINDYHPFLKREVLLDWMNRNLERNVEILKEKDFLKRHHRILEQTLVAYRNHNYELAIIGLYPIIEFFVANWILSQENQGVFNYKEPTKKPFSKETVKKIAKEQLDSMKNDEFVKVFFEVKALEGMHRIYKYTSDDPLSRNSVLHGSHEYSELCEEDYLKLFYLLYALVPLYGIVFDIDLD